MEINGKKVVDATKRVKIMITKKDTVEGDNKNPSSCAAARAAKRIENCISARVHLGRVYIEQKDKWVRYQTPEALRSEIIAFDRGGSFQPGEYTLRTMPPSSRETSRSEARRERDRAAIDPNRPNKLKRPRKVHVAKIKHHAVAGVRPKGGNR
jgi:hypothetical protein